MTVIASAGFLTTVKRFSTMTALCTEGAVVRRRRCVVARIKYRQTAISNNYTWGRNRWGRPMATANDGWAPVVHAKATCRLAAKFCDLRAEPKDFFLNSIRPGRD